MYWNYKSRERRKIAHWRKSQSSISRTEEAKWKIIIGKRKGKVSPKRVDKEATQGGWSIEWF